MPRASMKYQSDSTLALGRRLRIMRKASGLTLRALSEKSRLGLTTVLDMEHGRYRPRIDTVGRWAAACGYELDIDFKRIAA